MNNLQYPEFQRRRYPILPPCGGERGGIGGIGAWGSGWGSGTDINCAEGSVVGAPIAAAAGNVGGLVAREIEKEIVG